MRMRAIRMIAMKTWSALRNACTSASLAVQRVELAQDLHGLSAQLTVGGAPVILPELAHPVVQFGVADLAVLGLLRRLERGALVLLHAVVVTRAPQRSCDHERHDAGEQHCREHELDHRSRLRSDGGLKPNFS